MKKNNLIILGICFFMTFLNVENLISADSTIISDDMIKEHMSYSLYYSNRGIYQIDDSIYKSGGNNFICLELGRSAPLYHSKDYNLAFNMMIGCQFGNVSGNFASNIYFKPAIVYTNNRFFDFYVSSGLSIFNVKNNNSLGGFGINPELGITVKIYDGFRILFRTGTEIYPFTSYHTFGLGIIYQYSK